MEFSFLKSKKTSKDVVINKQPNCITFKSNISQFVDFILKEENIDFKNSLKIALESMSYEEIEKALNIIKIENSIKFDALLKASNELIQHNVYHGPFYGFQTKTENDFEKLYNDAKNSLNTGDLVAFLLNRYLYFKSVNNEILRPLIKYLINNIVSKLKGSKPLLITEIDNQLYIPVSKALFVFFIYDKKEALNKFKNITRKDLRFKNNSDFELEHQETTNRFFNRLGLNYIPKLDIVSEKFDINLSEEVSSISKTEIFDIIDKADYFNRKIPLTDYPNDKLINPNKDFTNLDEFTQVLSILFKDFYFKNHSKHLKFDLGSVFIDNITNPYPIYPDDVLIRTREILKNMLSNDLEFRYYFFYFIYTEKESDKITGWVSKFPKLFNHYLGELPGLLESVIKRYFFNKKTNPVFEYNKKTNDYLVKISS